MSSVYKTYYDIAKIVLWSDNPNDNTKKARLNFGFRDGNPRITVYTGVAGKEGFIPFPADIPHMTAAMTYLKDIANGPNGQQVNIESLTNIYENNKLTPNKRVVSTLTIGKSKEGIVFIAVTAEGKPKIVFPIKQSDYHIFKDKDKNVIPDTEISKHMAIGVAEVVLNAITDVMMRYTDEEYSKSDRKPVPITEPNGKQPSGKRQESNKDQFEDLDELVL